MTHEAISEAPNGQKRSCTTLCVLTLPYIPSLTPSCPSPLPTAIKHRPPPPSFPSTLYPFLAASPSAAVALKTSCLRHNHVTPSIFDVTFICPLPPSATSPSATWQFVCMCVCVSKHFFFFISNAHFFFFSRSCNLHFFIASSKSTWPW